jgi:hypothetical protein
MPLSLYEKLLTKAILFSRGYGIPGKVLLGVVLIIWGSFIPGLAYIYDDYYLYL